MPKLSDFQSIDSLRDWFVRQDKLYAHRLTKIGFYQRLAEELFGEAKIEKPEIKPIGKLKKKTK